MNATIITAVVSLIGILAVGVLVPVYLVARSERMRREDQAEAEQVRREEAREAARLHREDRDAEWARQDRVAERAAEATRKVTDNQRIIAGQAATAADLLLENNKQVAETQKVTNGKLDIIHTLVNSNLTAAMQAEYDAVKRELAMMREVIALRRTLGQDPSPDSLAEMHATEKKLAGLAEKLEDRHKAQDRIDPPGVQ